MPGHFLRHAVNIAGDSAKVHGALATLEGLKDWTMAEVSGSGGVDSTQKYPGGPTFVWQVTAQDNHNVASKCASGPSDSAGTTVTFDLGKTPHGCSRGKPSRSA
jgi:hypothetical protein